MKKYISYLIVFIFAFMIYQVDSIHATVMLYFNDDGSLVTDSSYQARYDDYYTYENGVLHLKESSDDFYSDATFRIRSKSDLVVEADNGVHISQIDTNKNLEIKSSNKNNKVYIDTLIGGHGSDELYIHDIDIEDMHDCLMFYHTTIDNAVLNSPDSGKGVYFHANVSSFSVTVTVGGEVVYQSQPEWASGESDTHRESYTIKNSHVNIQQLCAYDGSLIVEDSTIQLTGYDLIFMNARNSEVSIKRSEIYPEDPTEYTNMDIYKSNYDATFEDSTITVSHTEHTLDGSDYLLKTDYIKNTTFNVKSFNSFSAQMENSTVNTERLSQGYIDAKDSTITVTGETNYKNSFSLNYIHLDNSTMTNVGSGWTSMMKENDYSVKLVNNSKLEITDDLNNTFGTQGGIYLENSSLKSDTNRIYADTSWYTAPYDEKNGAVVIINSTFIGKHLIGQNDMKLTNSKVTLAGLELDRNTTYGCGGNLIMNNSDLYVDNQDDDSIGIELYDLDFNNSHLIAKGTNKAWYSTIDITTHNLAGINEEKSVMQMKTNESGYSFFDNGVISKYAEIRTPLKVTFKIVNGTWKDGTTEDKIVETYFFGSIKDVDVPVEMIANTGYKDGSWDKEIIYDELKDEYVYTYTFKEEDPKEEPKKEEKKTPKKEEKKLKNPDTGAFISFITIGVLLFGCIKVLKFTKKKKLFNRL